MAHLTHFFDLNNIAFTLLNYNMSWVELIGTLTGLLAVWLSAREHIANWGIGILNIICFFFIFYKTDLYADMFLQVYFFVTGIYGWIIWAKRRTETLKIDSENTPPQYEHLVKVSYMTKKQQVILIISIFVLTIIFGYIMLHLNTWLPRYFPNPTAFPFADSLVMVMSVMANLLLTRKKIESWILWVAVDIVAPILYFQKGLLFMTIEYLIFLVIATFGLINWLKIYKKTRG